ncbi:PAS domain-containing protein [Ruegeria aquimaris]|uniref:PAS domain-containing protein n=1 Tax=Ruegeria aquimaris TaxID=2984333 RepID=A0ABT3AMS3_9RHOB|nr:PAS domain-containing protein [Ruegeria sp. XHP0148]MCV2889963.1 PAS domain-containing protein [Ruegeria sp. XHP0148]
MTIFLGGRSRADTGNVISMDRFRSGRSVSPIRQAEAYWSALRRHGDVPNRSDIDPRGLENILEYTFILERIAPGVARFRLAGNHLSRIVGMEVRGMPMTALFSAMARAEAAATLEHIFLAPAIAELSLISGTNSRAVSQVEARAILLPLKNDLGEISRALGVLVADGPLGAGGLRFDIAGSNLRKLDIRPDRSPAEPVPGLAEDQAPIRRNAPGLRVVSRED